MAGKGREWKGGGQDGGIKLQIVKCQVVDAYNHVVSVLKSFPNLHLVRVVSVPAHDLTQLELSTHFSVFAIHRQ